MFPLASSVIPAMNPGLTASRNRKYSGRWIVEKQMGADQHLRLADKLKQRKIVNSIQSLSQSPIDTKFCCLISKALHITAITTTICGDF